MTWSNLLMMRIILQRKKKHYSILLMRRFSIISDKMILSSRYEISLLICLSKKNTHHPPYEKPPHSTASIHQVLPSLSLRISKEMVAGEAMENPPEKRILHFPLIL